MRISEITGAGNAKIKQTARLFASASERRARGCFPVEGLRLCQDAVRAGYAPILTFFTRALYDGHRAEVDEILARSAETFQIPPDLAKKLSDTVSPQGICCVLPVPPAREMRGDGRYIGLERGNDPGNLGAVARTAEALGLDGVVLVGPGCDLYAPKAQRAAMGSLLRIPVHRFADFADFTRRFPAVNVFAAVVRGGVFPQDTDFSAPCMVLIGNEANGLREETIRLCDGRVSLPMRGGAESMNAAAAASIFMWEMTRRPGRTV